MALLKFKRKENSPGEFFVDKSCIDCGTCYWMASEVFANLGGQSAVVRQPIESDKRRSFEALFSCPTNSIGYQSKDPLAAQVAQSFPLKINDDVFHTGYHSERSYGAASYFIRREKGNVLVDSPRFHRVLANRMIDLGGVSWQYLTHKDDVADTDKWQQLFQSTRCMHEADITDRTKHYEEQLRGIDPIQIDEDLLVIPVPGHTRGHTVLLYKNKYLFTGDHLAWSHELGHLYAFKRHCWYDWSEQIVSMKRLLDYRFQYILPGHSAPFVGSEATVKKELERCLKWMQS